MERLGADALRATITCFRDTLRPRPELDRLNVYPVPDGDTGTNMARTLDAVVIEMDAAPLSWRPRAGRSPMARSWARWQLGVILSQILRGMTTSLEQAVDLGPRAVASALTAASEAAYEAVLRPIEGTILTVARRAAPRHPRPPRPPVPPWRRAGRREPSRPRGAGAHAGAAAGPRGAA